MSIAVWGLAVGALTSMNVVLVRAAYAWEKNRSMSPRTTLVVAALLIVAYSTFAIGLETG